jgi:hypothetical protein
MHDADLDISPATQRMICSVALLTLDLGPHTLPTHTADELPPLLLNVLYTFYRFNSRKVRCCNLSTGLLEHVEG